MKHFRERSEVSLHLVKVYKAVKDLDGKWITNKELAAKTGVALRTVSAHTLQLVHAGIVNQAEVFPAHRFQISEVKDKRNKTFFERLEKTLEIFAESGLLS